MLFIPTHTVYCRFSSGPSQGNNQSICESTATTNNQSTRTSNLPESPLVKSHLSAATVLEDGYDSDACQNHNAAIEMEGPQELDEPELGEVLDPSSPSDNQAEESKTSNNQPEFVLIPNNVITNVKVADLKAELSKCRLDTKGLKNVLLDHLKQAMVDKVPVLSNSELRSDNERISGFAETAKWKPLKPIEEPVAEPDNVVGTLHAPTIPEEDTLFVPQKHNFAETFDCSPFLGCQKIPHRHCNGHQMHDPHTNQPMWNEEVNINGGPRADWLKANNLDGNSSPADWFQAFLPVFDGSCGHPWVSNTPFWTHKWENVLNVKAASMGAGVQGGMYPDFKPFSYGDIEKHLALYILQGLNPSPQVEQNLQVRQMTQYKGMIFVSMFLDPMLFIVIVTSRPFSASKIQPRRCLVARNIQPTRLHPFFAMFKRYQCWLGILAMIYQGMNRQLASKESTLTNCTSHTRQRVMVSNVMLCAKVVSHGHFISAINQHQRNTYNKAMLHCTHAFLECLTSWMRNITTIGLTICTCLPSSAGLPLLTQM